MIGTWFTKTIRDFDFENVEDAKALMPESHRSHYQDGDEFFMNNSAFNKGAITFFLKHNGIIT